LTTHFELVLNFIICGVPETPSWEKVHHVLLAQFHFVFHACAYLQIPNGKRFAQVLGTVSRTARLQAQACLLLRDAVLMLKAVAAGAVQGQVLPDTERGTILDALALGEAGISRCTSMMNRLAATGDASLGTSSIGVCASILLPCRPLFDDFRMQCSRANVVHLQLLTLKLLSVEMHGCHADSNTVVVLTCVA
jgi:hypothetical protein